MGKSLQDQLLALGVADKKKAKQAKHQQRVESKEPKGPGNQESLQEAQQKAQDEKKARDQALATLREAKRLKAEKLAQVRDMVKSNLIDRGPDAQRVDFRFPYGKKINRKGQGIRKAFKRRSKKRRMRKKLETKR